jgi:Lrp/AsnC family leucine-responsive transcriptional regulator
MPDAKDRKILALVQRDASLAQAEIAKRVGLSTTAVNERLRKLEASGVIRRWVAQIDPMAVGGSITAFVEVFIEHPKQERGFIEQMKRLDEVLEVHHITGEFSLLLKLRARDMAGLKELMLNQLNAHEGVRQTRTAIVLATSKEESYVAVAAKGDAT